LLQKENNMQSKLSQVKAFMAAGQWQEALRIAARFHDLGEQKAAIKRAHEAYDNPRFYVQLGHNIDALNESGRAALLDRFGA
jgi:hypothetical protein